jgi:DNA-directed RNA polymerase specialized sigma24 family protein
MHSYEDAGFFCCRPETIYGKMVPVRSNILQGEIRTWLLILNRGGRTVNRFQNIDWDRLYKLLRVVAAGIVRRAHVGDAIDCGISAEDLVTETMEAFFASSNGLGWKAEKGSIEALLCGVLKKKAVDHLRRQRHVAGSLDDPSRSEVAKGKPCTPAPERARVDIRAKLYELVRGDKDLEDLLTATELLSGDRNVNQELGVLLNKTPKQVSNLKQRLLLIDGVKELYAERQVAQRRT